MTCQLEMKKGDGEKMEDKKDKKFNTNIVCKLQSMIGNGQYVEIFVVVCTNQYIKEV
jgi:hypothetical protein